MNKKLYIVYKLINCKIVTKIIGIFPLWLCAHIYEQKKPKHIITVYWYFTI